MSVNQLDRLHVGTLTASSFTPPASSVSNASIEAGANVDAAKLDHQHQQVVTQVHGSAAVDERRVIHVVKGATATLIAFRAGVVVACIGDSTITVDLRKNGTTMLTAVISIDSGDAAYAILSATLASTSLVTGDVLEVVIDATVGTGTLGQGLFAEVTLRERAQ
jgi:hypothetical protein